MPIIRKLTTPPPMPSQSHQSTRFTPAYVELGLGEIAPLAAAPIDMTGLTLVKHPRAHTWGWMARVYGGGRTYLRFFAHEKWGGQDQSLRYAAAWRDAARRVVPPTKRKEAVSRLVRVNQPAHRNVGWFVYIPGQARRYFSDARFGGSDGARTAAEAFLEQSSEGLSKNKRSNP